MTAYDVFKRAKAARSEIDEIKEKIMRREALAMGCTARPVSEDAGGHGADDASMKMLDYVSNVEQLRETLTVRQAQQDADKMCCLYLSEMIPTEHGAVLMRCYVDGMTVSAAANDIGYSVSRAKGIKREAEEMVKHIAITYWDGEHVPVTAIIGN